MCLARALLKRSKVLVLDEGSSRFDFHSPVLMRCLLATSQIDPVCSAHLF